MMPNPLGEYTIKELKDAIERRQQQDKIDKYVSWRKLLIEEFSETGDDIESMVTTLTDSDLDAKFDDGAWGGKPFTAWGRKYVYFPVWYDGSVWVGHAPRNPCNEATKHQGGG
jgi:hypothetical protein